MLDGVKGDDLAIGGKGNVGERALLKQLILCILAIDDNDGGTDGQVNFGLTGQRELWRDDLPIVRGHMDTWMGKREGSGFVHGGNGDEGIIRKKGH